VLLFDVLQC